MAARIDLYVDCNSPWSRFAFTFLQRNRQDLEKHGVEVDVHPIFLGGINVGSGNKPPWTLPAKKAYGAFDFPRGLKYFAMPEMSAPPFFPIMSLLPMRCMLYVKSAYPRDKFEAQFQDLWTFLWERHQDISKPEVLAKCLGLHFGDADVKTIIEKGTDPEYKKLLQDETAKVVAKGAFGAPWMFVTNSDGREEPFFGSDRFHFVFQYLGIPYQDIRILPPGSQSESKL